MGRPASVLAVLVALHAGGCSNVGRFDLPRDHDDVPSVKTIIQRVKCELAIIARDDYKYKKNIDDGDYAVALQLDIEVNDDGSLAPSFAYTNGVFSFNAGAKLEVSRDQQFTEQLFFTVAEIRDAMAADREASRKRGMPVDSFRCPSADTNLAGDLGIVDAVHMAFFSEGLATDTKLSGAKGAFGGNVNFVVTKNLNAVGPTYTLKHFRGPGSLAGVSETNTDKLTFAFAQRSAGGGSGTRPPAGGRVARRLPDGEVRARAANLLASIQTSQIVSQLAGISNDLR